MPGDSAASLDVLYMSWRDRENPEAGGAEAFLDRTAEALAEAGHRVTIFTSGYPGGAAETRHGKARVVRRGGRYTVFARGALHLLRHGAEYDVVVDVQNGVPFWSPLFTRTTVVNVVHHLHRDQWASFFGPRLARVGWWAESRLAPRVYRRCRYVTVSRATLTELVEHGVDAERAVVIYSGNDQPAEMTRYAALPRSSSPTLVVVGRLVPHKRIEMAIDIVRDLADRFPGLTLHVVGDGYWLPQLVDHARDAGVTDAVRFHGFVDENTKHELLAESWLGLMPSQKEGWGLTIVEAGLHETPTVAFRDAGGPSESIIDGETGLLADDYVDMRDKTAQLLGEHLERNRMGKNARAYAESFDWKVSGARFAEAIRAAVREKKEARRHRRRA